MSQRTTRWRIGTAAAALAALVTAACGTAGPQGDGDGGTFTVWTLQDETLNKVQQGALDRFNADSEVKGKLNVIGPEEYPQKLRVSMGSANAPDVFFNWGGGSIRPYVEAGQLEDLSDEFEADADFKGAFLASVLDAGKIDDKYYGVPLRGMQPVILFYNKKLFADAGLQPPASWEGLLAAIDAFKAKKITPFALAGATSWTELMYLEYLVDRIGGPEVFNRIADGDSEAWGDPAMQEALERIVELVDRGAFGTKYKSVPWDGGAATALFASGRAAMHLMGSWEFTNQVANAPEFAENDLAWINFPAMPNGKGDPKNVVGNPTNYFSVNAASKHKDAAIEFLKTQMADDQFVGDLVKVGDVPPVTGVDEKLAEGPNPEFTTWQYELVQAAPSFTLSWDQALPTGIGQEVVTNLQKVFNRDLSPEQFIAAMKKAK